MRSLIILVALALAACEPPTGPGAEPTFTVFSPTPLDPVPGSYADWYSEIEGCLGVEGDFAAVRWFIADSIVEYSGDDRVTRRVGLWSEPDDITMMRNFDDEHLWVRVYMIQHVLQTTSRDPLYDENGRLRCP